MLIVKSKYRIAKRLGAGVFDQTQTQKFALAEARTKKPRGRAPSDYNRQLLEKQRVRFTYGIQEKQLYNYAKKAMKAKEPSAALHAALEMRADTAVYRSGLALTRRAARQMVSHGHILINGIRITTPSYAMKKGDKITVREGSRTSPLFASLADKNENNRPVASWLTFDVNLLTAEVVAVPQYNAGETGLDYATVFEFYSR